MRRQNRVDRFFFGRIDEGAGVDDEHVGVVRRRSDFHSALEHASEHDLGVHQIFGAAETNHTDFCAHR